MGKVLLPLLLVLLLGVMPTFAADPLVVDVRTEAEWEAGHLEGAVLVPHDRIEKEIGGKAPDRKQRVYLYCRSGRRSGIAAEKMKKLGYEDVVNLGSMEDASRQLKKPIVK